MPYGYVGSEPVSGQYYVRDVIINVFGQSCKSSGVIYVDNVKLGIGSKTLCDFTFNSEKGTPDYCTVLVNNKPIEGASVATM